MNPEPLPDDQLNLEDVISEFSVILGRIQVPSDPHFPFGEGVRFTIDTPQHGKAHLIFPPELARQIGQGMIDTANHANELVLPDNFFPPK